MCVFAATTMKPYGTEEKRWFFRSFHGILGLVIKQVLVLHKHCDTQGLRDLTNQLKETKNGQ